MGHQHTDSKFGYEYSHRCTAQPYETKARTVLVTRTPCTCTVGLNRSKGWADNHKMVVTPHSPSATHVTCPFRTRHPGHRPAAIGKLWTQILERRKTPKTVCINEAEQTKTRHMSRPSKRSGCRVGHDARGTKGGATCKPSQEPRARVQDNRQSHPTR
jgi:hypothetical protein